MQDALRAGLRAALARIETRTKYERATLLGVSLPTLDRWANGVSTPRPENLARLARLAGMTQEQIRNYGIADRTEE